MQQKLTGAALLNFVKQCEFDALAACANLAAGKPDSDSFMDVCTAKAMEWGRAGATHIGARRPPIAQAGRDAVCAGLVFAESDDSASNGNLRCNAAKEAPGRFLVHPGAPDSLRDTWEPAVRRECEDTGSAYVPTTGAYTPQFPEGEETMLGGHTME